jgi:hypothetical protein
MQSDQLSSIEQNKRDIETAKTDLTNLINKVSLASVRDDTSDLDAKVANLPGRIQKIRNRGYAFNKVLESQAVEFQKQWSQKRFLVINETTAQSNTLQTYLRPLESKVAGLSLGSSSAMTIKMIQNELDAYETRVSAAESTLKELYDGLRQEFNKVAQELNLIEAAFDASESASFGFLPGEAILMTTKATWTRDSKEDKDDPEGILFLTDQRLLFEQREEIAKKKVLFVTTEREKVQTLLFEIPVAAIESLKATKQGFFKNEDWIELQLPSGFFARDAKLHLNGQDCNQWQRLINTVKSGDINVDRVIAIDKVSVEKARSAPAKCPSCGGAITKPVLRGMDSINCDFCGAVIRL